MARQRATTTKATKRTTMGNNGDGIVVSKEFYTNPASYGSVNIYRVMVKTASERTHKIENVNYEQYKKCSVVHLLSQEFFK